MPYTGDCHLVSCARDGQVRLAELSSTGTCRVTKKLAHHKGAAHKVGRVNLIFYYTSCLHTEMCLVCVCVFIWTMLRGSSRKC